MLEDLQNAKVLIGVKQSTQAVTNGTAKKAYVAVNADDAVKLPFLERCRENLVPIEFVETKEQLGKACGINVNAACAVICL